MNLRNSIFGMKVKVKDSHIDAGLRGGTAFSGCAIANYQCKAGRMHVKNTTVLGGECGIFSVNSLKLKNSEVRGSSGIGVEVDQCFIQSPLVISDTVIADHAGRGALARTGMLVTRSEITENLGGGIEDLGNFKPSKVTVVRGLVDRNGPFGVRATNDPEMKPTALHSVRNVDNSAQSTPAAR